MQDNLNLISMARELLAIHEEFSNHLINPYHLISDFELETFTQIWGNTSGGFEGIGGSAMTTQRTYVFLPVTCNGPCQVYFGGRFGYAVPISDTFLEDVRQHKVVGCHHKGKYLN